MNARESLRAAAEKIDKHFDGLLYDKMPLWEARQVEDARAKAHERLANEALGKALAR